MNAFVEEYIQVGGIQQFLLHYPKAPGTPVLLFLHGGPGNFESLFAYSLDKSWGEMFTQVHWDQRGAGKTLRRNKSSDTPQSVEQVLADLHGVVGYLRQKYQTDKVVLLGHSWGSVLGSLYTLEHPENVLAYIGVGQVVSMAKNERTAFLALQAAVRKAGNPKHLRALAALGDYPPADPEQLLALLRKMRELQQYYDDDSTSASGMGKLLGLARRSPSFRWGDFISFLRMSKANRPLLLSMLSFDLEERPARYQVPVHYILGEADGITPTALAQAYFDTIDAPAKTFATIPRAGHNPMYEQADDFAKKLAAVRATL